MRSAFGQSGSAPLSGSSSSSRPSCASLTASAPTNDLVIEKIGNGVSAVTGAFVARFARPEPPDQNSRPRIDDRRGHPGGAVAVALDVEHLLKLAYASGVGGFLRRQVFAGSSASEATATCDQTGREPRREVSTGAAPWSDSQCDASQRRGRGQSGSGRRSLRRCRRTRPVPPRRPRHRWTRRSSPSNAANETTPAATPSSTEEGEAEARRATARNGGQILPGVGAHGASFEWVASVLRTSGSGCDHRSTRPGQPRLGGSGHIDLIPAK